MDERESRFEAERIRLRLPPAKLGVRELWPWAFSIQNFVAMSEPYPRASSDIVIASDFGGEHPEAKHRVYCYLVVRGGLGRWSSAIDAIRRDHMPDRGVMSYKRLGDRQGRDALVPFLEAAADLDGHLVGIAVDKDSRALSTDLGDPDPLRTMLGLGVPWRASALESLVRKTQFAALLMPLWFKARSNVTWITDRDEFVQNDLRHDDALALFARMLSFFVDHPGGELRLHTTQQDPGMSRFEDLCSIPDLAAGMLSVVSTSQKVDGRSDENRNRLVNTELSHKDGLLADWFWDASTRLRKTMVRIDFVDALRSEVRLVSSRRVDDADAGFPWE